MEVQAGGCTGASKEHPLGPRQGLGFPSATEEILERSGQRGQSEGDGWAQGKEQGQRQACKEEKQKGHLDKEGARERDRAHKPTRGAALERQEKGGIFKGSPPFPSPVPTVASEIVADNNFKRKLWELPFQGIVLSWGRCIENTKASAGQGQVQPFWNGLPHPPLSIYPGAGHFSPAPRYSLDTCRRILLDRAVPNLLRAKH